MSLELGKAVQDVPLVGEVVEVLKIKEGFHGEQYLIADKPHIGYGTLLPLTEKEAEMLLISRFTSMCVELSHSGVLVQVHDKLALKIILDMMYQMGVPHLLGFKKMFQHLAIKDYVGASKEMLDSKWAKQTPRRAKKLASLMSSINKGNYICGNN